MCGIAGKINFNKSKSVESHELKRMTDSISHRGPDDEGQFIDGNVGLGFRRLSIIDLESGHQPLSDAHGNYWITFNGEIFNFKELREDLIKKGYDFRTNSDTEVIVNLYAEYKERCVGFLRGMFAFVIWDKTRKELFGARDRFGIKPFHYYIDEEKFVWGSEIKAIIASDNIKREISIEALDSYFAYGYIQREHSIFMQIKKLLPGHYFILKCFEEKKLITQQYWKILFEPDYSKSEAYWKEAIYDSLNEAVRMRLISDVPLGAFLSGGIDSSTVVALMCRNSGTRVKTFSIGFNEEKYNELKYARQVAEMYNTDHHELIIEPESIELLPGLVRAYDEPFADSSAIPTYYVSKFTRAYVTVALSGDGGDELFAGYKAYSKMIALNKSAINSSLFFGTLNKLIPEYMYGKGTTYYLSKDKKNIGAYFCFWKDYERRKIFNHQIRNFLGDTQAESEKLELLKLSEGEFISRMQQLDMQTYMVDDILTKVDRASMMNSLEARVPLLDHKFAELSFTIPSQLKINDTSKKYLLKETFKNLLPAGVMSHKKQGFAVPLNVWFKGDLREFAADTLKNSRYLYDYLNPDSVNKILKNHQKGVRDYSQKIWSLLFLNEWLNQNK